MKANGHDLQVGEGDPISHLRGIAGEKQLLGAILEWARVDLQRPTWCMRHELARAWTVGFFSCGCPNEQPGISIVQIAEHLAIGVHELRRLILRGVNRKPRARALRCRDVNQIELRFLSSSG